MNTRKPGKKATIKDVASLAGVSIMTVSRALRDSALVAAQTRKKVKAAAKRLNYIPDLTAGALASQRSGLIAVLLPSLRHSGFMQAVDSLSDCLRQHGYHLLMGESYYSQKEEMELLRVILGRRPEGIVMISSVHSEEGRSLLKTAGIPVVETWDWPDKPLDMVVGFSHFDAGYELTRMLIKQGYRKIGFIGGPEFYDPHGERRRQGHFKALKDKRLSARRNVIEGEMPMQIEDGAAAIVKMRADFPDTQVVVCMTDIIAFGAMMECRRRGWSVPEDIAITGFGDFDFSQHLVPPLTTVEIAAEKIGRLAANLLLSKINGQKLSNKEQRQDISFEIRLRESSEIK